MTNLLSKVQQNLPLDNVTDSSYNDSIVNDKEITMNKQISKLIKQATTIRYSGPGEIEEFDKEKFAELIVQECAGIYSRIDNGNLHMGTDNYLEALHKTFRS